jgi:hypothetical protein
MKKKSLIIGACTGYNSNQLKPWVESIGLTDFDGDKVMVVGEATKETKDYLISNGFRIVDMIQTGLPVHVARFFTIYNYLKDIWNDYEFIVTTDVKDVYFQHNPITYLSNNLKNNSKHLVAGSEGMLYKDEPWGNENLKQTYGDYVHNLFKDNEIYNVGTVGGHSEYVKDLVFNIFINAINRPIPIVDQAVYNVLLQTQPYKDITHFASQRDGWACQAGTTVDPSKIEQFRPFLTEPEPIFENGIVKTCDGYPFYIVHQYDRVPEWKEFVRKKFNQEDPSTLFVYKTA